MIAHKHVFVFNNYDRLSTLHSLTRSAHVCISLLMFVWYRCMEDLLTAMFAANSRMSLLF